MLTPHCPWFLFSCQFSPYPHSRFLEGIWKVFLPKLHTRVKWCRNDPSEYSFCPPRSPSPHQPPSSSLGAGRSPLLYSQQKEKLCMGIVPALNRASLSRASLKTSVFASTETKSPKALCSLFFSFLDLLFGMKARVDFLGGGALQRWVLYASNASFCCWERLSAPPDTYIWFEGKLLEAEGCSNTAYWFPPALEVFLLENFFPPSCFFSRASPVTFLLASTRTKIKRPEGESEEEKKR